MGRVSDQDTEENAERKSEIFATETLFAITMSQLKEVVVLEEENIRKMA